MLTESELSLEESKEKFKKEEIEELDDVFKMYVINPDDPDDEARISTNDISNVLEDLGFPTTEAESFAIAEELDTQKIGEIDRDTFLKFIKPYLEPMTEDELHVAFDIFDRNLNGIIGTGEIEFITNILGKRYRLDEIDDMVKEADCSGNSKITFDDFLMLMGRKM